MWTLFELISHDRDTHCDIAGGCRRAIAELSVFI